MRWCGDGYRCAASKCGREEGNGARGGVGEGRVYLRMLGTRVDSLAVGTKAAAKYVSCCISYKLTMALTL
jgi:hypothetical protein